MKDIMEMKGKIEIFDKYGNLYKTIHNLVLTSMRANMLQIIFNDNRITSAIGNTNIIKNNITSNDYKRLVCGFIFGSGGSNINVSPTTVYVPTHNNVLTLNNTDGDFKQVPFIITSADSTVSVLKDGSYENLEEIMNNSSTMTKNSTSSKNIIEGNSMKTMVRYFGRNNNNYYCKTFDIDNNEFEYNSSTGELEYTCTLKVDSWDLVGETISEVGLVMADCKMSGNNISEIDDSSVRLSTRATFEPISLTSELLTEFTMKYHIYF